MKHRYSAEIFKGGVNVVNIKTFSMKDLVSWIRRLGKKYGPIASFIYIDDCSFGEMAASRSGYTFIRYSNDTYIFCVDYLEEGCLR